MNLGNEHFTLCLLRMLEDGAKNVELGPFITSNGRPDWVAVDEYFPYAGSGDKALIVEAQQAWKGLGICGTFSKQDMARSQEVLTRLIEAYGEWLPPGYPLRETPGYEWRTILVTNIRGES